MKDLNLSNVVTSNPEAEILHEDVQRRKANEKHFLQSDGTYQAIVFPEDVHFKDGDEWKTIDNRLVKKKNKKGQTVYVNKAGKSKIIFAETTEKNKCQMSIKNGKHKISWMINGAASDLLAQVEQKEEKKQAKLSNKKGRAKNDEILENIFNESKDRIGKLKYKKCFKNTNIDYQILNGAVKETIILEKAPTEVLNYEFDILCKNLMPILNDDKTVSFISKIEQGKDNAPNEIFKIAAPFMTDSENKMCKDIEVNVYEKEIIIDDIDDEEQEESKQTKRKKVFVYSIAPSMEWLQSEERAYPVDIDPTIVDTDHPGDMYFTRDVTVSPVPESMQRDIPYQYRGYDIDLQWYQSSYMETRQVGGINDRFESYFKMTDFFYDIPKSAEIISAKFHVASLRYANNADIAVCATSNWWDSNGNRDWSTRLAYDDEVLDIVKVNSTYTHYAFDITSACKYKNNLRAIVLKSVNGGIAEFVSYYTSYGGHPYSYLRPFYSFVYADGIGFSGRYTYTTINAGRVGNCYIKDKTSEITIVRNDVSTSGGPMPMSIKNIYVSPFFISERNSTQHWKLNYDQSVYVYDPGNHVSLPQNKYYVHQNEYNVLEYYIQDSNNANLYKNEMDESIKLTVESSTVIKIKDKDNNGLEFRNGKLYRIFNKYNQYITIERGAYGITRVTDGSGRVANITYVSAAGQQRISKITSPDGRDINYSYTGYGEYTYDVTVSYIDGKSVVYSIYNDTLKYLKNIDDYKLSFEIGYIGRYVLKTVTESVGNQIGTSLTYDVTPRQTIITNNSGKSITYRFNNYGQTVCAVDDNGGAAFAEFDSQLRNHRNIKSSSLTQNTTINLIKDPSMNENIWQSKNIIGSTANIAFDNTFGYIGSRSLKMIRANNIGSAVGYQKITLTRGQTYTFSGYVNSSELVSGVKKGSAFLSVYAAQNGQAQFEESCLLIAKSLNQFKEEGWTRKSVTFKLADDAACADVWLCVEFKEATGTVWFDDMQLENEPVANRYNLLQNSNFEQGTLNWVGHGSLFTTNDDLHPERIGKQVYKIVGAFTSEKNIMQTLKVVGKKNDTFVFGGWAKANSIFYDKDKNKGLFRLKIGFRGTNGVYTYQYVNFSEEVVEWQYACGAAIAPHDFDYITIGAEYTNNYNTALFDGFQLYKDEYGQSYAYDSKNNLVTLQGLLQQKTTFEYDINDNLKKMISPKGINYTYEYDSRKRLTKAKSPTNQIEITYDAKDNITEAKQGFGGDFISSRATYTPSGNFIKESISPRGNKMTYEYDESLGLLKSVTDAKGDKVKNTYDNMLRLSKIEQQTQNGTAFVEYDYENDRLKKVRNNNVEYEFEYDAFGNETAVKVNGQTLTTNHYDNQKGLLLGSDYANGQQIRSVFDDNNQIKEITYNGIPKYRFDYDINGNCTRYTNLATGKEIYTYYDLANQQGKVETSTGDSWIYKKDINNSRTSVKQVVGGMASKSEFTYDNDNRPTESTYYTNENGRMLKHKFEYDNVGNLTKVKYNNGTSDFYEVKLGYHEGRDNNGNPYGKTSLIKTYQNGTQSPYNYEFDEVGNLIKMTQGNKYVTYEYDQLNQLVRENSMFLNQTRTYTYDLGGNMLVKKYHPYTEKGQPVTSDLRVMNYTYGSAWNDQLTSYAGMPIIYDETGCMKSFTLDFTWDEGRKLVKATRGAGWKVEYGYEESGLRSHKIFNGIRTDFIYEGSDLVYQKEGDIEIRFNRNQAGALISMTYEGQDYTYLKNALDDIVGLMDKDGNVVVEYSYDAWGVNQVVTGPLKDTVGDENPYRYRGYYYDWETGMFYLKSRYYNPEICRFINADNIIPSIMNCKELNIFVYCNNNPIRYFDNSGLAVDTPYISERELIQSFITEYGMRSVEEPKEYGIFIYSRINSDTSNREYSYFSVVEGSEPYRYSVDGKIYGMSIRTGQIPSYDGWTTEAFLHIHPSTSTLPSVRDVNLAANYGGSNVRALLFHTSNALVTQIVPDLNRTDVTPLYSLNFDIQAASTARRLSFANLRVEDHHPNQSSMSTNDPVYDMLVPTIKLNSGNNIKIINGVREDVAALKTMSYAQYQKMYNKK